MSEWRGPRAARLVPPNALVGVAERAVGEFGHGPLKLVHAILPYDLLEGSCVDTTPLRGSVVQDRV